MKAAVDDEANFESPDKRGPEPTTEAPQHHEVTEARASPARGAAGGSPEQAASRAHASPGKHQNSASRPTKQGLRQLQADADRRDIARSESRAVIDELGKQLKQSLPRSLKKKLNSSLAGKNPEQK